MKSKFITDPLDTADGFLDTVGAEFYTSFFSLPAAQDAGKAPIGTTPTPVEIPPTPALTSEAVEALGAQSGPTSTVSLTSGGITINLLFDAAAMAAPASFRAGIQQAAALLTSAISDQITVNIKIDYSGTGGGAAAGPDNGLYESYSSVRTDLVNYATPGDPTFNALPSGSSIQGQSSIAVWNAQLKLWGLLGANDTTTDDGSATFATDINSSLLVGVALHELTHAMGRVPYGSPYSSSPDVFDFFRFTSAGVRMFSGASTASAAYFSIDGGNTKLADYGQTSDPADFLNSGVQGASDPFNEFYFGGTLQSLTAADKAQLDALGFHTSVPLNGIIVSYNTADVLQGGPRVTLLSAGPSIVDAGVSTLTSATIKIANGGGSAVAGDQLYVNGVQNGSVGSGVTASWNASTGTLTLTGSATLAVYSTLLGEVGYTDTGTDASNGSHPARTVTWSFSDGTNSYSTTSVVTIDRAPVVNSDAASDAAGSILATTGATGVLSNDTDLDRDALSITGVSDVAHGAGSVGVSLAGVYGHLTLNADGSYAYSADISSAINAAPANAHAIDTFTYTASDGNRGSASATLNVSIDRLPIVTGLNKTATHGQVFAGSSLLTTSDPDGDAIATYAFWDSGGVGHFVLNGVVQAAHTEIDVSAAQLAQISYVAGQGSDLLSLRVSDGTAWSSWTTLNVTAPAETAPVVTGVSQSATHGQVFAASSLLTASDPDGDAIATYAFWDSWGTGHFVLNGVVQPAHTEIDVSAAQLSQLSYVAGGSPDLLSVRASDGNLWSDWTTLNVTVPVETAPVVTGLSQAATHGQVFAASSLVSATDANGDPIATYAFWDSWGTGHFVLNGVVQAAHIEIDVSAAQLSQLSYVAGLSPDLLSVRASDGILWSDWTTLNVVTPVETAPVVTSLSQTATHGQVFAASSLLSATDANGDPIATYAFWDSWGTGHFVLNGVVQPAHTEIDVSAAQLSQLSYVAGGSPDLLSVRASDGNLWSDWTTLNVTVPVDTAPVVTGLNQTATHGQVLAGSSLLSASDADGDPIATYAFWDSWGAGHFVLNGVVQPAHTEIDVSAAQLSQLSYVAGLSSDLLSVRVSDGTLWSDWATLNVVTPAETAPVVTGLNQTATPGQVLAGSSLLTASDTDGDPIATYAFWDSGGVGHFVLNGVAQPAHTEIDVSAAQLSQLSYVAGSGSDLLSVRASDGNSWSAWTTLNVTVGSGQSPSASTSGQSSTNYITANSADQGMLSGTGNNDTFVFKPGFGQETVTNFATGADAIEIDHSIFANVQALLAATHDDTAGNAVITADANDTIMLKNVTTAQLVQHQDHFFFT